MTPSTAVEWAAVAVYLQPFAFLLIYRLNLPWLGFGYKNYILPAVAVYISGLIFYLGLEIGPYKTDILAQYCLMVGFAAWLFRRLPMHRAAALAFLIVFINSWIWEAPIHVLDFIENKNVGLQIFQGLHLAPLIIWRPLTGVEWWPRVPKLINPALAAWIVIVGLTYLRLEHVTVGPLAMYGLHVSRALGLAVSLALLAPDHSITGIASMSLNTRSTKPLIRPAR